MVMWCDWSVSISSQFRAEELLKCPASTWNTREEFRIFWWVAKNGKNLVGDQQRYSISHPAIVVIKQSSLSSTKNCSAVAAALFSAAVQFIRLLVTIVEKSLTVNSAFCASSTLEQLYRVHWFSFSTHSNNHFQHCSRSTRTMYSFRSFHFSHISNFSSLLRLVFVSECLEIS